MLFFQTIPRSFVAAYCFQFSLVKSKANSNLQKRKWCDGKIFISIFYRQFIINLYLYSGVILPTILRLVYKKWASSSLPFNQFCFFLNPKFSLFNLKTEISSLLLKSKNGSDWSWPIYPAMPEVEVLNLIPKSRRSGYFIWSFSGRIRWYRVYLTYSPIILKLILYVWLCYYSQK